MKEIHFTSIDSTNKYIQEHEDELENLTFVSSDYQSRGKGRNNRVWSANKNENLLFSLLIKDKELVNKYALFSIGSAACLLKVLHKMNFKDVSIKWPNDVYIKDKKVCGILLNGNIPHYVIIGIGINVNQKEFNGEYRITPTSLYLEKDELIDIQGLKESLFKELIEMINDPSSYIDLAINNDYLLNKEVNYEGSFIKCLGIEKDARMKASDNSGNIIYLSSGEIN